MAFIVLSIFAIHGVSTITEHLAISEFSGDSGTRTRHVQHNIEFLSLHGITERLRLKGTPGKCPCPTPSLKKGYLKPGAQEHIQMAFEHLLVPADLYSGSTSTDST